MKKKSSTSQFGFLGLRVLVAMLLCTGVACLLVAGTSPAAAGKLALLRPDAPAKAPQRALTFARRVSYQRAIEDVYWRHRIWPTERPDPKPPLDAVMSHAQLEKQVTDYLRNSQTLEDYWQRPITAEQLQAEMDRMAQHTREPEVLRELCEALGNDPFVIAECLARPALAERLLANWYAFDQRIHGDVKQRAEADLKAHPTVEQMKSTSGKYSEIELFKSDSAQQKSNRGAEHSVRLNSHEWDQTVQRLAAMFGNSSVAAGVSPAQTTRLPRQKSALPATVSPSKDASITQIKTGVISSLQEDGSHYYATAIRSKPADRVRRATVSWFKEPLESWMDRAKIQVPSMMAGVRANYTLPKISEGDGCIDDTWTATAGPPDARTWHTAIWT